VTDDQQANKYFEFQKRRTEELRATDLPKGLASNIANLEHRIANWPADWGNELRIVIYGDFQPPETEVTVPELGIVIEPERLQGTITSTALCALRARVTVTEKSIKGIVDASIRINTLLGVWAAVDWGNVASGWWCHVTHEPLVGVSAGFELNALREAIAGLEQLEPDLRRKITSALYWLREPRHMMRERYRSDVLRVYAGYWNAFESLVEAVCLVKPEQKSTKVEKQARIDTLLADRGGKLDLATVVDCYRMVEPGFVSRASHALRACFPERIAKAYIHECFKTKPEQNRLYNIRNSINHGDIEPGDVEELCRIDDRHTQLWMIVFGMLGRFVPLATPVDPLVG
jgi:hypothetical protein